MAICFDNFKPKCLNLAIVCMEQCGISQINYALLSFTKLADFLRPREK